MEFVNHKWKILEKKKCTPKLQFQQDFPTPSNEFDFAKRKELNKSSVQVS